MDLDEPEQAELMFFEQADGRKVSRLAGGKVVLVDLDHVQQVKNGERWLVRLRHRETYAIAQPVRLVGAIVPVVAPATPSPKATVAPPRPPAAPVAPTAPGQAPAPGAPPAAARPAPSPAKASTKPSSAFKIEGMLVEPENILRARDRVAIFIDGANTDFASRSVGYFVDYRKARDYFLGPGTYYAAFYYVADFTASDPLQAKFLDALSYAGYIVRRKPVKRTTDNETGELSYKGNLDTEIVLDMVNTVDNYDVAFLFSGDSDFERAVELLRSKGKRVFVVSSKSALSRELAYVADKPVFFLEDFESVLKRDEKAPPK